MVFQEFVLPETDFIFTTLGLNGLNDAVRGFSAVIFLVASFLLCLIPENNYRKLDKITFGSMFLSAAAFIWAFLCLSSESVFLYFNF